MLGIGLSRTGTTSLWAALGHLGMRAYHGISLSDAGGHSRWAEAANGPGGPDLNTLLSGYDATAGDVPVYAYWREMCDYWPNAKVILTVRDEEAWCDSFLALCRKEWAPRWHEMVRALPIWGHIFCPLEDMSGKYGQMIGDARDRRQLIEGYRRHTENVRNAINPGRLLVYDVRDGWGPLARHLGMDEPGVSMPKLNDRNFFARDVNERGGRYYQIWLRGGSMVGVGVGTNFPEACMRYALKNPDWAKGFDEDRLLYDGRALCSSPTPV